MKTQWQEMLLMQAQKVLKYAYAKYSGIHVAAALLCEDGTVFTGVNVENASYGLTVCAERNAIFSAVGQGHQHFIGMAIVSDSVHINSPCGACRQVMMEFSSDMIVVLDSPAGFYTSTVADLLPNAFTMQNRKGE